MYMFFFIDADSWDLIVRDSPQFMKKELRESLLRKESAFPKNTHFKFQVYEKDRS